MSDPKKPRPPRRKRYEADTRDMLRELDDYTAKDFSRRCPTGLATLDLRLRGGLHSGEVTLIGAPTGGGKTSLVQMIALKAAVSRGAVLFVSPEMSLASLLERDVIRRSRTPLWDRNPWTSDPRIRAMAVDAHLEAASEILREKLPLYVIDDDCSMLDIEEEAADMQDLALIVIDYAQQVAGAGPGEAAKPRHLQVADIARRCVALARARKVPVLLASQVNTERTPQGRVTGYTFRESKELENKASTVLIFDIKWDEAGGERFVSESWLQCTKNRFGPTFRLRVNYEPSLFLVGEAASEPQKKIVEPPARKVWGDN